MLCALYETDDGFIYVGPKSNGDDPDPPTLSPLFMSTDAARQWMTDHPEICSETDTAHANLIQHP